MFETRYIFTAQVIDPPPPPTYPHETVFLFWDEDGRPNVRHRIHKMSLRYLVPRQMTPPQSTGALLTATPSRYHQLSYHQILILCFRAS